MRNKFVETLVELAKKNKSIELVTGDLGFGVLKPFWENCPDQFTNAGIAEQNMTSLAAGMALEGKIVFTYSIGNFPTLRCLEQIRNDCAYHNANVKIVCVGGGFVYGSLGMSHHATEDLSVMRALPNMVIMAPGDTLEMEYCLRALAQHNGPGYLRLGRGGEPQVHSSITGFAIGKAIKINDGDRVALFSTGAILSEVIEAKNILLSRGVNPAVFSFPTIKPIDKETICACAKDYDLIVTCEENNITGGFGSAVAEILCELKGTRAVLRKIGIKDIYCSSVGDQKYLRKICGIDAESIAQTVADSLL